MELMADGLAGHEFDFYSYVKHSAWTGGHHDYSDLHEAAPYWFNYIVPLAYGLNNPRLKDQVRQFVQFVVTAQSWDGWLGPELSDASRDLWARFPLMLGLSVVYSLLSVKGLPLSLANRGSVATCRGRRELCRGGHPGHVPFHPAHALYAERTQRLRELGPSTRA